MAKRLGIKYGTVEKGDFCRVPPLTARYAGAAALLARGYSNGNKIANTSSVWKYIVHSEKLFSSGLLNRTVNSRLFLGLASFLATPFLLLK